MVVAGHPSGTALTARRFPLPWSAELQPNHYVVRDANKQQIAYVYYENEPGVAQQPSCSARTRRGERWRRLRSWIYLKKERARAAGQGTSWDALFSVQRQRLRSAPQ